MMDSWSLSIKVEGKTWSHWMQGVNSQMDPGTGALMFKRVYGSYPTTRAVSFFCLADAKLALYKRLKLNMSEICSNPASAALYFTLINTNSMKDYTTLYEGASNATA